MRGVMESSKRLPWKSEPNLTQTRRPIWGVFHSMSPTEALRRQTSFATPEPLAHSLPRAC